MLKNNKLIKRKLDSHDAHASWNQTIWFDTKKSSISNSGDVPIDDHKDSIEVLCPTKVYHFDDTFACFIKNPEDGFISRLAKLPIIFNKTIFDQNKMGEEEFTACDMHVYEGMKPKIGRI